MAIDTEAMVEQLVYAMCEAGGECCSCREEKPLTCRYREMSARAALSHLLPQIIELCAETAALDVDWASFGKREIEQWDGGPDAVRDYRLGIAAGRSIATAIRALIPTQGADHD